MVIELKGFLGEALTFTEKGGNAKLYFCCVSVASCYNENVVPDQGEISGLCSSENGFDLVIEMPNFISLQAAEFFAFKSIEILNKMAPFGTGNAEPRLAFSGIRIAKADIVGFNHVRCFITGIDSKKQLSAIAFRCVDSNLGQSLLNHNGVPLHIVGRLRENNWQGRSSVQLLIDDAAPISSH